MSGTQGGRGNASQSGCQQSGQQTRDIQPMLYQCWSTVYDAGPTLVHHWVDVSCLLGGLLSLCSSLHSPSLYYILSVQCVYHTTRGVEPMLDWCWANVADVGPTSTLHWFNVSWLLASLLHPRSQWIQIIYLSFAITMKTWFYMLISKLWTVEMLISLGLGPCHGCNQPVFSHTCRPTL